MSKANWEKKEQVAIIWKQKIDPGAILLGGSNSQNPDIQGSDGKIDEVKSRTAQCGQFTPNTAYKYKYSDEIQEYFMGLYDADKLLNAGLKENYYLKNHEICKKWVYNYYKYNKKVNGFIEVDDDFKVTYYPIDEYFNTHSFSCTYRRKKSGSSNPANWVAKYIPSDWEYTICNGKWKVKDLKLIGQSFIGYNTNGIEKTISVEKDGYIKVLSDTYTPTWIFSVR